MEHNTFNSCIEEFDALSNEYRDLEAHHKIYRSKLDEVNGLQQQCMKGLTHQRYRIAIIKASIKKLRKEKHLDPDTVERIGMLETDLVRRTYQLHEMENVLPKSSGSYLKVILGNINVSILNKNEKFRYKNEYEKFKLVMSVIALIVSFFNCYTNYRTSDTVHMFLLVWYYCTLTIRESILKVNGSRIKGWWRAHHFISTVLAGVMLVWPNSECYLAFRGQFMLFNAYISVVQYLQFMYQKGCLYRLKALGQRHNMDITVDGFQSWMWKGLGGLLPFLFIGYFWELYHAYTLYYLRHHPDADWHVTALCGLFFLLFMGNCLTTAATIPQKLKERFSLKYRFIKLDKYIWTHKKRRVSFRNPDGLPEKRVASVKELPASPEVETEKDMKVRLRHVAPAEEEVSELQITSSSDSGLMSDAAPPSDAVDSSSCSGDATLAPSCSVSSSGEHYGSTSEHVEEHSSASSSDSGERGVTFEMVASEEPVFVEVSGVDEDGTSEA